MRKGLVVIVVALGITGGAFAQGRASGVRGGSGMGTHVSPNPGSRAPGVRVSSGRFDGRGFRRPFRGAGYWGGGFGWPYYYYDFGEDYYPEPQQAQAPPPPAPAPVAQERPEPPPSPVLLELRGNQWVRVDNFTAGPVSAPVTVAGTQIPAPVAAPAVLVYRDGHSEELSSYSIIGPVIYARSDYWSSGNWTRKIQIADLDLPATFKQNQERGVKFELPSGPDEVMIRP